MAPSRACSAVRCWASVVGRGKRELAIELRNRRFRMPALSIGGFGETVQTVNVREVPIRRSRRTHASVDALCTRTGSTHRCP